MRFSLLVWPHSCRYIKSALLAPVTRYRQHTKADTADTACASIDWIEFVGSSVECGTSNSRW